MISIEWTGSRGSLLIGAGQTLEFFNNRFEIIINRVSGKNAGPYLSRSCRRLNWVKSSIRNGGNLVAVSPQRLLQAVNSWIMSLVHLRVSQEFWQRPFLIRRMKANANRVGVPRTRGMGAPTETVLAVPGSLCQSIKPMLQVGPELTT
jgi:hypothetical protein